MNKLGIILGIAAVAVIAGCKDPNYQRKTPKGEASNIGTQVEQAPEPDTPVVVEEKHCARNEACRALPVRRARLPVHRRAEDC